MKALKRFYTVLISILCLCICLGVCACKQPVTPPDDDPPDDPPVIVAPPDDDNPPDNPPDNNPPVDQPDNPVDDVIDIPEDKRITISFYSNLTRAFDGCKTQFIVEKGKDAAIKLNVNFGYCVNEVGYSGKYLQLGCMSELLLVLYNVRYDEAIFLDMSENRYEIRYHANGGSYIAYDTDKINFISQSGYSENHLRKNTSMGVDMLVRDGYTLTGWNTSADGTGTHIGLGSRVSVFNGQVLNLYAEWAQWTDCSQFEYTTNEYVTGGVSELSITAYKGANCNTLVIPEKIDGHPVSVLDSNFADGKTINTLILPRSIKYLGDNSRLNITTLYMSDTLLRTEEQPFGNTLKKIYLNAGTQPRMAGSTSNGIFAEAVDRIIYSKSVGRKNLVFFGGCSMSYGLDCSIIDERTSGAYWVTDIGINGDINMLFQFECLLALADSGDIIVHVPEFASEQSMLAVLKAKEDCGWMFFTAVESNYDLLSIVDFGIFDGFFSDLVEFNQTRSHLPVTGYEPINDSFNEYCDCVSYRESDKFEPGAVTFNDGSEHLFNLSILNAGADRLNACYKKAYDKGITMYLSFIPINIEALKTNGEYGAKSWLPYMVQFNSLISGDYITVISRPEDYFFEHEYIYDEDYHLTTDGAVLRTERLFNDLRPYI